jgi:hypothetical protein
MGLNKLCLTAGLAVLGALCFAPGALAWTFSGSGSATCDRSTGEHVITWSIDNRTEPEALTIRESSRSSVAVGSTVAARSVRQYTERVAGSTTGALTLTVKGNWPSDRTLRTRIASVTLTATCLTDVCPNLTGVQEQVPSGLVKDTAGNCVTPPTDVCPNLAGVQEQVPSGLVKDTAGNCVTPPTDVCPNLAGVQEQVPSGLVKDTAGNCVTPPTDVCPNIEGLQTSMPANFAFDADGECGYLQQVVTITIEKVIEKTIDVPGPERVVQVAGPERVVTVAAAPVTVEKIVTKVVIKRVKAAPKKVKRAIKRAIKRKVPKPRLLPFTPQ